MLHGYCVRLAGQPGPSGVAGVGGAAVELLESDRLGIWFSRVEVEPASLTRLRDHEVVVRTALLSATPLPLRFGSVFSDEAELTAFLHGGDGLLEKFTRIGNRVEMGCRVSSIAAKSNAGQKSSGASPASGRAYLEGKREAMQLAASERESAAAILEEIERDLADIEAEVVREVDTSEGSIGSMAHLLRRRDVTLYRSRLLGTQQRRPDLRITATGPWAPYSFV